MPTDTDIEAQPEANAADEPAEQPPTLFVDAATRVSHPSAFDNWYYGIEDKLGQGTVGMGVCMVLFAVILLVAILWMPI